MGRGLIYFLFISMVFLLCSLSAQGQAKGITMQAEALYEGTSKYGEWLPVVVQLENSGADIRGRVQGRVASSRIVNYAHQLELPRGARKQVTIFVVPNNTSRHLIVEFVAEHSEEPLVSQKINIHPVPNIRFMAAAISADNKTLDALAGVNFRGEQQNDRATLVPLTLATLPERPDGLRTLDLIVLSGIDTSTLTPRQQAALEQYVALGGMLVLGGGPDAKRVLSGIPKSLHPVSVTGEVALNKLTALNQFTGETIKVNGPFPAAESEVLPDSSLRLTEGRLPMVVEREVGHGIVYWLALDPSLTPFDAWSGTEAFWLALVGNRAIYPVGLPPDIPARQIGNSDLFYALQNQPVLDLPSLTLLLPLLLLYIVIVGPVNYLLLRRRQRLELAWATIPMITLLFTVGAYGIGYYLRGSDLILNQISLVQAIPNSDHAYVRSIIGLFSPSRYTYNLSIANNSLLSPPQFSFDSFANNNSNTYNARFVQGEPALMEGLTVNQWSMQSIMAESLVSNQYEFESDLQIVDGQLQGTITNHSNYMWQDVVVVLGNNFTRLGDMAPAASQKVSLQSDQRNNTFDITWQIFEETFDDSTANRDTQIRQQIFSSLYNAQYGVPYAGQIKHNEPLLLAWIDQAPTQVNVLPANQHVANDLATTLLYSELPIRLTQGKISLPRDMIDLRIIKHDGSYCDGTGASLMSDFKEAHIQLNLPNKLNAIDPSQLIIYFNTDGGDFISPQLSLYEHQKEQWVKLPRAVLGRNKVREPDVYLHERGFFLLRVENQGGDFGACLFFDAALEGVLN